MRLRPVGGAERDVLALEIGIDIAEGLALAHQHARHPGRLGGDVDRVAQREARRHREAVLDVAVALAALRQVDGDEQRRALRVAGARDDLFREAAVAEDVELEPERLLGRGAHVLDGADRHGGERVDRALGLGGARRQDLAVAIDESGEAGGRDRDRQRQLAPEHLGRHAAAGGVDQHALAEAHGAQLVAVGVARDLVVGAAVDVVEHHARAAPAREPPQVLDVGDDRHRRIRSVPR